VIIELAEKRSAAGDFPISSVCRTRRPHGYALDLVELFRHAANDVGQILSGTNPGEIPYYQMTKFELVINLKTAEALGLTIAPTLFAQANEAIE
jgi:putative tryptophan/tyrosine transport system substrate-binding protein